MYVKPWERLWWASLEIEKNLEKNRGTKKISITKGCCVKDPLKDVAEGKGRVKKYVLAFGLNVSAIHIDREQPKRGRR